MVESQIPCICKRHILSDDDVRTFETLLTSICNEDYVVDFTVIDTRDYGVPQKREHVYMVAIREDLAIKELPRDRLFYKKHIDKLKNDRDKK